MDTYLVLRNSEKLLLFSHEANLCYLTLQPSLIGFVIILNKAVGNLSLL